MSNEDKYLLFWISVHQRQVSWSTRPSATSWNCPGHAPMPASAAPRSRPRHPERSHWAARRHRSPLSVLRRRTRECRKAAIGHGHSGRRNMPPAPRRPSIANVDESSVRGPGRAVAINRHMDRAAARERSVIGRSRRIAHGRPCSFGRGITGGQRCHRPDRRKLERARLGARDSVSAPGDPLAPRATGATERDE